LLPYKIFDVIVTNFCLLTLIGHQERHILLRSKVANKCVGVLTRIKIRPGLRKSHILTVMRNTRATTDGHKINCLHITLKHKNAVSQAIYVQVAIYQFTSEVL